jgi:hypothetical protein
MKLEEVRSKSRVIRSMERLERAIVRFNERKDQRLKSTQRSKNSNLNCLILESTQCLKIFTRKYGFTSLILSSSI